MSNKYSRGLIPRDYKAYPHGSLGYAKPFEIEFLDDELRDRIREMTTIRQLADEYGYYTKDQNGLGYCWVYSVTRAAELARLMAGDHEYKPLSPESVGGPINDYRNEGGWCGPAIEYAARYGFMYEADWPKWALDPKYDDPAKRESNKIFEWFDLEPGNKRQLLTALVLRYVCPVEVNAWGHAICATVPHWDTKARRFAWEYDNSWLDWGDHGRGYELYQWPNAAYAVRSVDP